MQKSWENIFDLNFGIDNPEWLGYPDNEPIQATFWELRREWIIETKLFYC